MPGLVKIGSDTADSTMATGVSEDYLSIKHYDISKGRDLQYSDIAMRSKVCVVGAYVDQAYFGGNAVGQTLRVRGQTLTVVGVIQQQSDDLEEGGTDDCLFLPYSVAERMAGSVNAYTVTMQDEDHMDESVNALESALYEVFASDDYYTVTSMAEMLDTMTGMINILVYVLAGIAAISLVVGGIGIMNIMLVSVRAHPGDRHPQIPGGQGAVYHAAVRHRGGHDQRPGRCRGHSAGLCAVHRGHPGGHPGDGGLPHRGPHLRRGGPGLRHLRGHRHPLRIPPRPQSRRPQPHRRAAL